MWVKGGKIYQRVWTELCWVTGRYISGELVSFTVKKGFGSKSKQIFI